MLVLYCKFVLTFPKNLAIAYHNMNDILSEIHQK